MNEEDCHCCTRKSGCVDGTSRVRDSPKIPKLRSTKLLIGQSIPGDFKCPN